jgi:hypothetical protein
METPASGRGTAVVIKLPVAAETVAAEKRSA